MSNCIDCNTETKGCGLRCTSCAHKGKFNFNSGKQFSKEHREKISKSLKGKHPSLETRLKQSLVHKDKVCSAATKLKMSLSHKGRVVTEETKRKIGKGNSIANKGKKLKDIHKVDCTCSFCKSKRGELKGKNSYNYIEGLDRKYPLTFDSTLKEQIRTRDAYTCQECGFIQLEDGRLLDIHHIDYDKNNNNEDNLITLCRNCHVKTNYNREHWENYFNKKGEL